MRKVCGVNDRRIEVAKKKYEDKKDEASATVGNALSMHNVNVMNEIGKDASKKGLYKHIRRLMNKGSDGKKDKVCLLNEDGRLIVDTEEVISEIELFWGRLFTTSGNAVCQVQKSKVDDGMHFGCGAFSKMEIECAI